MGNGAGERGRPRGCNFASFGRPEDLHSTFDVCAYSTLLSSQYLQLTISRFLLTPMLPTFYAKGSLFPTRFYHLLITYRERKAINELLYSDVPTMPAIKDMQNAQGTKSLDSLNVNDQDLLAVALGAPARQVLLRAEEVGPRTGWRDGYLSREYGFCPPDADEAASALARSPGRVWSDVCERMPGCVARGRVRQSLAALPLVEGTPDIIPDRALWAALVSLGMLCSIYRYEETHNGTEGVNVSSRSPTLDVEMSDDLGDEVKGIPKCIGLPYVQISRRMGRSIPHLTFYDQASYNIKVRDPTSIHPYIGRFDNTDLRWPMFGVRSEISFLKGCADTSGKSSVAPIYCLV